MPLWSAEPWRAEVVHRERCPPLQDETCRRLPDHGRELEAMPGEPAQYHQPSGKGGLAHDEAEPGVLVTCVPGPGRPGPPSEQRLRRQDDDRC